MKHLIRVFSSPVQSWFRTQHIAIQGSIQNIFSHFFPQPQLIGGMDMSVYNPSAMEVEEKKASDVFDASLWFAAPKSKVSTLISYTEIQGCVKCCSHF